MTDWKELLGRLTLKIICADQIALLNAISNEGIVLKDTKIIGDLDLEITIRIADFKRFSQISKKHGASVKVLRSIGFLRFGRVVSKRPVLVVLFAFMLFLTCYLPSRVLFVSVEGNTSVPTNLVLEAAEKCGIRFGVSRKTIRSEILKNALLQEIPQLQWAGINTSGCTAVISVREKTVSEINQSDSNTVCSIVALRDGIIQNCTVFEGNPLCTVGQAVKAGQILVSGYQDCGILVKATHADAEISALTFREIQAVIPQFTAARGDMQEQRTCYAIKIGKKVINLFKDSGNSDPMCVKMYSEKYVRLPGGFQLPIAIIKVTHFYYTQKQQLPVDADQYSWLDDFARSHLQTIMIAGQILSGDTTLDAGEAVSHFYGKYACVEMIGQVKYEQMILKGDKND